MKKAYTPDRGDVIWLDFSPQSGHEQAGRRPAVVLSPHSYNLYSRLALVCRVTSKEKGYPFEVAIPEGFKIQGVILADHLKSVDFAARNGERIFRIPEPVIDEVERKLLAIFRRGA